MTQPKQKNVLGMLGVGAGLYFALLLAPGRSDAAPITFSFSGSVSDVHESLFTPNGAGANGFTSTLPLSGNYTFESSGVDGNPSGNIGNYANVIQSLTVNVGTYTATFSPGTSLIRINNSLGGSSYELVVNGLTGNPVLGQLPTSFHLELSDPIGSAFSSDALPTAPPSLSSFASVQWRLIFDSAGKRVQGALTALVPLPAAVWLFGAGLIALVGLGSRSLTLRKGA